MLPHTCIHALKLLNQLNDFNEIWYKHCFPLNDTPTLYFEFPTIGKDYTEEVGMTLGTEIKYDNCTLDSSEYEVIFTLLIPCILLL
jgi:hypothetical protein